MDLQPLLPPQNPDNDIGHSRASSQAVKHTHAENVEDLDSDGYVV